MSELPKNNVNKKGKILDVIAKTDDGQVVNIELNNSETDYLHRRNAAYAFNLYAENIMVSETYQDMNIFIQINLTNNRPKIPLIEKYTVNGEITRRKFIDNLTFYEINIQKAKKSWYNKPNSKRLLALLGCDEEELNEAIGDGFVERIKKDVKELNEDVEFVKFLSEEDEERLYVNSVKKDEYDKGKKVGIEQGVVQGIEQGIEQEKINTAKNMLKENIGIDIISKVTGLSIEEIQKLI